VIEPQGSTIVANYMLEAMRADAVSRDMVARCFPIATFAKVVDNSR